jgi:predicted  nucleic acid-binding Zn-ribbon protein
MDRVTKEMFEVILQKLDKLEGRFDGLEGRFDGLEKRFDGLETEVKEFRAEMKDQVKGLDGRMDIIYHKLNSDINDLNPTPKQKYNVAREE